MSNRGKRIRVGLGVYKDRIGYSVVWRSGGRNYEKRFGLDTPLHALKDYRRHQVQQALPPPNAESHTGIARDVVRFLKFRKGLPSYKSDRSHLRPWVHRFKGRSRWAISREDCGKAIAEWSARYSPKEIRHRVYVLQLLFRTLDGPRVRTPLDDLDLPKVPRPRPISVADGIVRAVAEQLQQQEQKGRLHDSKTRARYLILATTGQRPAQLMRATAQTVDLDRRMWFVTPAKGDRGTIVYLNDDMLAAWQLFVAANAWGEYDTRSFARTLRSSGWPVGVRPYALRHSVGLSLSERGVDLGDIQAHMGHSSTETTRRFYVPAVLARLKNASVTLEGRLAGLAVPTVRAKPARKPKPKKTGNGRKQAESTPMPPRVADEHSRRKSA